MARQIINTGTIANDGTGDTLRQAGRKINDNFGELFRVLGGDSANVNTTIHLSDSALTFPEANGVTKLKAADIGQSITITLPDSSGTLITDNKAQTLTNKTLDSAELKLPSIKDADSSHNYRIVAGALTADVELTIPDLSGDDTLALLAATQTFTNKTIDQGTLDSATLNAPAVSNYILDGNGAHHLGIEKTASAVNYININNNSTTNNPKIAAVTEAPSTDSDVTLEISGRNRGTVHITKPSFNATVVSVNNAFIENTTHVICNKASALALALGNGTSIGEVKYFTNRGTGNATITPTNLAGSNTTITIQQWESVQCIWDGNNWFVTGGEGYALA